MSIRSIARAAEAPIRLGLRVGFGLFRKVVTDAVVAQAMKGQLSTIETEVPWNLFANTLHGPIRDGIMQGATESAREAVKLIPRSVLRKVDRDLFEEMGFRFDATNDRAVRWAEREAAKLVVNLSAETRQAVRAVIVRMFADGVPPEEAARMLRGIVGLHPRYALAVDNLRRTLTKQGREDVTERVTKYAQQLERSRATMIARTESIAASNAGQQELWRQASTQGLLDTGHTKRQWILTPDERLCDICAPVPTEGPVGLEEEFTLGDGTTVLFPPAHPSCRCAVRLVFE